MPVRVLAVSNEVTCEFQLVRRVVREKPGCRRVTQAHLEKRGRKNKGGNHCQARQRQHPRAPPSDEAGDGGQCDDADTCEHRNRSDEAEIPLTVREPHEKPEGPVRINRAGSEQPGIGTEQRDVQSYDGSQRSQHDERFGALDVAAAGQRPGPFLHRPIADR